LLHLRGLMAPYFSLLGFSRASLATICLKRLGPPSHPDLVRVFRFAKAGGGAHKRLYCFHIAFVPSVFPLAFHTYLLRTICIPRILVLFWQAFLLSVRTSLPDLAPLPRPMSPCIGVSDSIMVLTQQYITCRNSTKRECH